MVEGPRVQGWGLMVGGSGLRVQGSRPKDDSSGVGSTVQGSGV